MFGMRTAPNGMRQRGDYNFKNASTEGNSYKEDYREGNYKTNTDSFPVSWKRTDYFTNADGEAYEDYIMEDDNGDLRRGVRVDRIHGERIPPDEFNNYPLHEEREWLRDRNEY